MIKWRYKVIPTYSVKEMLTLNDSQEATIDKGVRRFEDWLNEQGKEGWEFVDKGANSFVFKKASQES